MKATGAVHSAGPLSPCHGCDGRYTLGYNESNEPCVLHSLPWCAAYEALETTADAVAYSQKCRAAALIRNVN